MPKRFLNSNDEGSPARFWRAKTLKNEKRLYFHNKFDLERRFTMDRKAQGAIEYLLIIGAAILIVAIVILAVTGILSGGQTTAGGANSDVNSATGGLSQLQCNGNCTALDGNACCNGGVDHNVGTYCNLSKTLGKCVAK